MFSFHGCVNPKAHPRSLYANKRNNNPGMPTIFQPCQVSYVLTMLNRLRAGRAASTISNISHSIAEDSKAPTLTLPQTLQKSQANPLLSVPWLPWTRLGWEIGCVAVAHRMRTFALNVSTYENRENVWKKHKRGVPDPPIDHRIYLGVSTIDMCG
ncbi:hypothetical protein HOY80DRAFT_221799 [Tuber brumale]|nr:hypothetical protein HOY80DRAFT_221799 [Tuber brumale]